MTTALTYSTISTTTNPKQDDNGDANQNDVSEAVSQLDVKPIRPVPTDLPESEWEYELSTPYFQKDSTLVGGPAQWPFRHVKRHHDGQDTGFVAISAPLSREFPAQGGGGFREYERLARAGYQFLGISSYQEFPGPIRNPHQTGSRGAWFHDQPRAARRVVGWLTLRNDEPSSWLPADLPRLAWAESDCMDPNKLTSARHHEKRYDLLYSCYGGGWNEHCRNWALACVVIPILVHEFGLSVVVVGRTRSDRGAMLDHPLIRYLDKLPWCHFQTVVQESRFLFLPNVSDASPRLLTECLCRDIPVLAHRDIHGGYKYLNPYTAATFTGVSDVRAAVRQLLVRAERGEFRPREFFCKYKETFRPRHALARFVESIRKRRGGDGHTTTTTASAVGSSGSGSGASL